MQSGLTGAGTETNIREEVRDTCQSNDGSGLGLVGDPSSTVAVRSIDVLITGEEFAQSEIQHATL